MKQMGGGIVLCEHGEVIHDISLPLGGLMSAKPMKELIEEEKRLESCCEPVAIRLLTRFTLYSFIVDTFTLHSHHTKRNLRCDA